MERLLYDLKHKCDRHRSCDKETMAGRGRNSQEASCVLVLTSRRVTQRQRIANNLHNRYSHD